MKNLILLIVVSFLTQYSISQGLNFERISQDSIFKITGTLSKSGEYTILDIFIENRSEHPILIPKIPPTDMGKYVTDSLFSLSLNYPEFMWDHYGFPLKYYFLQGSTAVKYHVKRNKTFEKVKRLDVYFSILRTEYFNPKMIKIMKKGIKGNDIFIPDNFRSKHKTKKYIENYYYFEIPIMP